MAKPRKPRKVVKLVKSKSDPWRHDWPNGFIIIGNPDGSRPDIETANLLLDMAKIEITNQAAE